MATSAIQLVLGLVFVLALIIASLWLLKRLSARGGASAGLLSVVAGIAVGPRERVVLVQIGETWLVLGVAPGQVRTLHQMPRAELPAEHSSKPSAAEFRSRIQRVMERNNAPG